MALEAGTYINDLISTNPVSSDQRRQGDDHLRLIKSVVRNTFPNADHAQYFERWSAKSANYTTAATDKNAVIGVDATAAARTITLHAPSASAHGFTVTIMKMDATLNAVTIAPGAGTINGVASLTLGVIYDAWMCTWTGSTWTARPIFQGKKYRALSASTTLTVADFESLIDVTAASPITLTLPAVSTSYRGRSIWIKFATKSATGTVTVDGNGSETIDGVASFILRAEEEYIHVVCTGTAWSISAFHISELGTGVPSGSVFPYAGASAPSGYLLCFGQAVSRTTYENLFNVIGTIYGAGDGSSTFNVPDLRGRVPAGQDDMGGTSANRLTAQPGGLNGDTLGAVGGDEQHTLTIAQLPAHGHPFRLSTANQGTAETDPIGGFMIVTSAPVNNYAAFTGTPTDTAGQQIGGTGSGDAHNIVQPTIILNYIIKI